MLKLEGLGFSQAEVVKELSQKCACSRQTVYHDFESRVCWQHVLQSVIDSNKDSGTVTINRPVKGHRPRILTVSQELIARLEAITQDSERIFNHDQIKRAFYYKRKTTSRKLANPRLLEITFITFRHWFGTTEYHKTKDVLHVQRLLGHKSIQSTLIYIDLETKLFNSSNDGFTSRVAHNVGESCSLVETGFDYVTGEYNDGGKIFRRRI